MTTYSRENPPPFDDAPFEAARGLAAMTGGGRQPPFSGNAFDQSGSRSGAPYPIE
jgi:hypothetical protein